MLIILGTAFLLSKNRRAIPWRIVGWGLGLQMLVALFVLAHRIGLLAHVKDLSGREQFLNYSFAGSTFVFGPLGDPKGQFGFIFAFQALPMIIFVASIFLHALLPAHPARSWCS